MASWSSTPSALPTETDDNGEETEREIPFLKGYAVFNAEQCAGLPAQYAAKAEPPALPPAARIERADRFFAATGVDIRHGGTRAFYAEGPDYVQMPPFETFRDAESHAATLAHELTHATKHEKRLARVHPGVRNGAGQIGRIADQNLEAGEGGNQLVLVAEQPVAHHPGAVGYTGNVVYVTKNGGPPCRASHRDSCRRR